jgi:ABC-type transport system substrate-binding protein
MGPRRASFFSSSLPSFPSVKILFVLLFTATSLFAAAPPRRPNILRLARTEDPMTLDPLTMQTMEDSLLWPLLYLPLLDVTNRTELVPCAARAWKSSPDQRVFTLWLRPGVRFSNGREVTAADYVYGLERCLNPATGSIMFGYLKGVLGAQAFGDGKTNHVAGVRAPSADTLVIELERSDPTFPFILTAYPGTAVPREEVERLGPAFSFRPVGDGPNVVQKWVRGARLQFARNPYYQGPEPPHLDGVDVLIGGDETTHLMMFERGELDLLRPPFPSLRRMTEDPHWHGLWGRETLFGTANLILNTEIPPLDNVLVRRAMNHAINRDLRMHVAQGLFTHGEGAIPPTARGYNPRLRGYDHNPARAQELLRESGLALPLRTELWHTPGDSVEAQGFQWDLDQVGIKVELKPVSGSQITSAMQTRRRVPMAFWGWNLTIPDPVEMLGAQFDGRTLTLGAANNNLAFFNNPEVNRLLDLAAPETDLPKRYALYQQAEELIVRDAPWVFLGHRNLVVLHQPWLKGPLVEPLWWVRYDRVWIEN